MHNLLSKLKKSAPLVIAIIFFYIVGIFHLGHFSKMPGDLGDSRLNNYFLENIYLFLIGKSDSLIHLKFFYPFPYILGFSDNLFGMAPAYVIPRFLGILPDTSFQLWFIFGYILNYVSCYYVLKRLSFDELSSSVGAIIFTYAPPVLALINHVQLQYRFGIPLAAFYFLLFLKGRDLKALIIAMFWTIWQFYCGIYIGFFLLVLLGILFFSFFLFAPKEARTLKMIKPSAKQTIIYASLIIFGILSMLCLLYPYLEVSKLYHFKRSWHEIEIYLPKLRSYILSDGHIPWRYLSYKISMGNIRGEHQLFIGFIPMALLLYGLFKLRKEKIKSLNLKVFSWSLLIFIIVTFCTKGISIWYLFHKLPLFSAIRAVARIILAMLLPISVISTYSLSILKNQKIKFLIIVALVLEIAAFRSPVSSKDVWRKRESDVISCIEKDLSPDTILYFTPKVNHPRYATSIDAMIASQRLSLPTINGYSGHEPPRSHQLDLPFPEQYFEGYTRFSRISDKEKMLFLERIKIINLNKCNYSYVKN